MADFTNFDPDNAQLHATMNTLRRIYLSTPRDRVLGNAFDKLFNRATHLADGSFVEGRALTVVGNSGAGKTSALNRILAKRFPDYGKPSCLAVSVTAKAPCTLMSLGRRLLRRLGYPLVAIRREHEIWEEVSARLAMRGTRIVYIDEMQNITSNANVLEAERIRDTLKSLLNDPEHPVCLILAGLPELAFFLEADFQICRRAPPVKFQSLSEGDDAAIKGTIKSFASAANLPVDFQGELAKRLIAASLNEFGTAIEMTIDAIENALESGADVLNRENFSRMFAARTGNLAPANVFVADNWRAIDCRLLLLEDPNERDEPTKSPTKPRGTGRKGRNSNPRRSKK